MKMFSDCSGECCICACGDGGCLAGHGDDDFSLASKEQLISRLDNEAYQSYTGIMIGILKSKYNYDYKANAKWNMIVYDFDDGFGDREYPHCTNCHSCYYRHRCCKHCPPKEDICKHWKLGKCYTCKFVDDSEDAWYERGCEAECFGGCRKYKRDWNKTFDILRGKYGIN